MGISTLTEVQMKAYLWSTTTICILLTIFRAVIRWRQQRRYYADDWWSFAGLFFLLVTAGHLEYMLPDLYEQQRRADLQTPHMSDAKYYSRAVTYAKLLISIMEMFWSTLWCVKFSFLMLIKRLLGPQRKYIIWWWITTGFTLAMWIAAVLSNMLTCTPIWRRWSLDPETFCGTSDANNPQIALAISLAFDAPSDLAIMVLPLFMLRGLNLNRSKRLAVQAMFCLSTPVILVAVLRVALICAIGGSLGGVNMYLWVAWTWTEPWVAMVIVHVPAFKLLFEIAVRRLSTVGWYSYGTGQGTGASGEESIHLKDRPSKLRPDSAESERRLHLGEAPRDPEAGFYSVTYDVSPNASETKPPRAF